MRKVIWTNAGMNLIVQREGDGPVSIIRTTDYDSGGPRSVEIPLAAIKPLTRALEES